jgi:phosphohistidine phosphatase
MKTLLILRHAKSSWRHAHISDHERPLNERGQRDAPRVGQRLRQEGPAPELIVSSSARRALATAEAVAAAVAYDHEIAVTRSLYHAGVAECIEILQSLPDKVNVVMIVGHNPGLEELLFALTGAHESMPTAALAHIQLPIDTWLQLSEETDGRLLALWLPRDYDRQ